MNSTKEVRHLDCPACVTRTPHLLKFKKDLFDILACTECGLGRSIAPDFDPHSYYTEDYFAGGHDDGYADYVGSEPVLRTEFRRLLADVVETTGIRSGRLLDVGCAYGFLLLEAKDNFECHGIEISETAASFCRTRGLSNVETGVASADFFERHGKFDLIFMLDVIEHLEHPLDVLRLLSENLTDNGVLVVTTGDFSSLTSKVTGSSWRLMTPPQHLWFFTPESMKRLAFGLSLDLRQLKHPWKVVPLSLVLFQLLRMIGMKPKRASQRFSRIGLPVNLFDAMRVLLKKS